MYKSDLEMFNRIKRDHLIDSMNSGERRTYSTKEVLYRLTYFPYESEPLGST